MRCAAVAVYGNSFGVGNIAVGEKFSYSVFVGSGEIVPVDGNMPVGVK